ncbi:nucleotidyltransferase [Methylomusa anaerophila]|uniref:tRNA(Met) cytidine acetate ligase n=2 Tax=Methylomusa anaerophila TaxID=1930071 RepID=A0A348AQ90_9FIRM|nr:nucleotidyltransferase [Methylomusa anaerophila]BBB93238.1 hypothetical protein MAMMFC1_03947 [Methylomusa anaerophila]
MIIVGIIAEYNPFHNGHLWHINQVRKNLRADYIIAGISGNFVQRGEPAIFDKWSRAEMAIKCGVDLVVELPFVFAVRSAQYFAGGGVRLLASLGINHLSFGAECADLKLLSSVVKQTDHPDVLKKVKVNLKAGHQYAAALTTAIADQAGISMDVLNKPNNILAIEYIKAIKKYAPTIMPVPIQRYLANHHGETINSAIASATALRQSLLKQAATISDNSVKTALPPTSTECIEQLLRSGSGPVQLDSFSTIILSLLRNKSLTQIAEIPEVGEGLHNRIKNSAIRAKNATELLIWLKSKRYPQTRLQRILIHTLVGTTKSQIECFDHSGPLYGRILGFNTKGRQFIKEIGKQCSIPLVTKTSHFLNSKERSLDSLEPHKTMLAIDTLATDVYTLGLPNEKWRSGGWDFLRSPVFIPN